MLLLLLQVALPALPQLTRLDLSGNRLSSVDGLAACAGLKWLNLASNQISSLGPLASLSSLQVQHLTLLCMVWQDKRSRENGNPGGRGGGGALHVGPSTWFSSFGQEDVHVSACLLVHVCG